jgi:DNA-binding beta-propeller fold protein YncE
MSARGSHLLALGLMSVMLLAGVGVFAEAAHGAPRPFTPFVEYDSLVVGGEPKDLLLHPAGDLLFVSDFRRDMVSVVDLRSRLVTRRLFAPGGPAGIELSEDGRYLFVASFLGDKLFRYDLNTGFRAIVPHLAGPWAVTLVTGPGGKRLIAVSEQYADRLTLIDPISLGRVATVATSHYPYQMDEDRVGRTLYIAAHGGPGGGRLDAVDLDTLTLKWTTPTPRGSFDVEFDPETDVVLVTNYSNRSLSRVSPEGRLLGTVPLAGEPREVTHADGFIFVSLQPGSEVSVLDQQGELVYSASVGGRPSGMVWLSRTPGELGTLAVANEADGTVSLLAHGEPTVRFRDVPSDHIFAREIHALKLRGALQGYRDADGFLFRPDASLLRAQTAKVLVEALSLPGVSGGIAGPPRFEDVPSGTVYPYQYVQAATAAGIIRGVTTWPPRFAPYERVTRVQLVRMLLRSAESVGSPLPPSLGPVPFKDVKADDPDYAAIAAAYSAGLISGRPSPEGGLTFDKYRFATRGQVSKMVFDMLARLHEAEVYEG